MKASDLALKMLEWEELTRHAGDLAAAIEAAVLDLGKTQTVGSVRASYSGGRRSFDYEGAGDCAPAEAIEAHTETITKIDWKKVCERAGIEDIPFTQSPPKVTLKLLDG